MVRPTSQWVKWGAVLAAAVLGVGFAVGTLDGSGDGTPGPRASAPGGDGVADEFRASLAAPEGRPSIAATDLPVMPDRIVRSADLSVEVKKGSFERAWARAFQVATQFDGSVISSNRGRPGPVPFERTVAPDDRTTLAGDIVIRVPADRLDAAVTALRSIGTVTGEFTSSRDVTQEFVDLESRLRHLRAQEAVLLGLMAKAQTIQDTIVVQDRLSGIQMQIEEITGRLQYLKARSDFSTVTLHLAEPGALAGIDEGPSFSRAWETAIAGLERIATAAMIGLLWTAPFLLGIGLWLGARRWRARPAPSV